MTYMYRLYGIYLILDGATTLSGVTLQAVLQTQIVSDSECLIFREMHASTKVMPCCVYCVTLCFVLLAPLAKTTGLSS